MDKKIHLNDDFMFWFILIDIFFLPYFNIIVIPISFFIIVWWALTNRHKIKKIIDYKEILICIIFMVLSTIWGAFINSEFGVTGDNIKRLIQYIITFEYYFFFRYYFSNHAPKMKKTIYLFVIFVVILAVLFQISPSIYSKICSIWNKGNAYISSSFLDSIVYGYTVRYGFIWTDQNNIAYAITSIILFALVFFKNDIIEILFLLVANIFVLTCTMSSGGWISFVLSWSAYFIYKIVKLKKIRILISKKNCFNIFVLIIVLFAILESGVISDFFNSNMFQSALERFETNENTRSEIWLRILKGKNIFNNLLFGEGSTIVMNGNFPATHSGHLYWIYAYGFISYFIFIKQFFWLGTRKIWRYIPLIGFFLCFTMNTMVGEQKLFIIFIMIVSYLKEVKNYEINSKLNSSSV